MVHNKIKFQGIWETKFNPNDTMPRDFYTSDDKTIQVPTMKLKSKFRYAELSDPSVQVTYFNHSTKFQIPKYKSYESYIQKWIYILIK